MNPKKLLTAALLLFVAVSLIVVVIKASAPPPESAAAPATPPAQPPLPPPEAPQPQPAPVKVVAYYFHGDVRCQTCRRIETYTREALDTAFADELKDGRLEWRVINVDQPGNDRYIREFQLSTRAVVLERLVDGRRQTWQNLDRVWELVGGDKQEFLRYIREQTRGCLAAAGP